MLGFRYKDIYLFLFNANFLPIFFVALWQRVCNAFIVPIYKKCPGKRRSWGYIWGLLEYAFLHYGFYLKRICFGLLTSWPFLKETVISFKCVARYMELILDGLILSYFFRSNGDGIRLIRIPLRLFFWGSRFCPLRDALHLLDDGDQSGYFLISSFESFKEFHSLHSI